MYNARAELLVMMMTFLVINQQATLLTVCTLARKCMHHVQDVDTAKTEVQDVRGLMQRSEEAAQRHVGHRHVHWHSFTSHHHLITITVSISMSCSYVIGSWNANQRSTACTL